MSAVCGLFGLGNLRQQETGEQKRGNEDETDSFEDFGNHAYGCDAARQRAADLC